MDPRIQAIEQAQIKSDRPHFKAGDTVRVFVRIAEEDKTRIQPFEGVVIARKGGSSRETFTVRRISYGEGVERSFYLHSPFIEKILVVKHGHVRRAKLYYLRKKVGKGARISSTNPGGSATLATEIGESANPGGGQGGGEEHFGQAPEAPTAPSVRSETSPAASA